MTEAEPMLLDLTPTPHVDVLTVICATNAPPGAAAGTPPGGPPGATPGQVVRAVWRPGLPGAEETAIGPLDSKGCLSWTPAHAGLTALRVGDHEQRVAVEGPFPINTALHLLVVVLAAAWIAARTHRAPASAARR